MNKKNRDEQKNSEDKITPMEEKGNVKPVPLKGFVLMPFGVDSKDKSTKSQGTKTENNVEPQTNVTLSKDRQDDLFKLLLFALNDAYYQNYVNKTVRDWKPIQIERADTGAGRSPDLLDNVFLKINDCDFCLADLSDANINVALEIGYAYARNKYIIKIQQEEYFHSDTIMSDLAGKVRQPINISKLLSNQWWKTIASTIEPETFSTSFFDEYKIKLIPFEKTDIEDKYHTFFAAWIKNKDIIKNKVELDKLEKDYEEGIVKPLYPTIRPLWENLDSGGTEMEYTCDVFASREAADYPSAFANAKKRIRILTTNLHGLVQHIDDILLAVKHNPEIKIEILTLDPESEFVNARGTLIGKEISEFRQDMKDSLKKCVKELKNTKLTKPNQVLIRIYREFPTQITYIIDDCIYSSVVSVNHQSRHNIVFKIPQFRKGVENSFLQHWDTIWARAINVKD